jgi:hypothetical protein
LVASQLERSIHRLLRDDGRGSKVPAPDLSDDDVEHGRNDLGLFTAFKATSPDGLHFVQRLVEPPGPRQDHDVLHAWPNDDLRLRFAVLQVQCPSQTGLVDAFAMEGAEQHPHAQRLTQQLRLAEPLGMSDRVLSAAHGCGELADMEQGKGGGSEDLYAKREIVSYLTQCALETVARSQIAVVSGHV